MNLIVVVCMCLCMFMYVPTCMRCRNKWSMDLHNGITIPVDYFCTLLFLFGMVNIFINN